MKKIFGLCVKKGVSPSDAACSSRKNGKGEGRERNRTHHSQAGYHIRKRDLRMIHEAATEGNADAVQDILRFGINGLNDRDRKRRTPLHLACANGHSEVVAVLVERKCLLNLFDNKKRTALTKAVQCADEKSVTILLEHGADPNFMDKSGNTALHYAVFGDNISIAEKLLLHNADVEARNKAGLTPLHLARKENNEMMVELLAEKTAAGDSVHNTKSDCHRISSHQEDNTSKNSCQSRHLVNQCSVEDSLKNRLSSKSDVDDPWPTSQSKDYNFGDKTALKPNSREVPPAPRLRRKNTSKCGTEDNDADTQNEDVGESHSRAPVRVDGDSHPASAPSLFPVKASLNAGLTRLPVLPRENRRLMVELVAKKSADVYTVHNIKRHYQRVSSYQEDHTSASSSQSCSPVNQCSVEDSLKNRLSSKSDVDDPWPTSQSKDYNFGDKTALKPNSREVPPAPGLPRKNTSKCGTEDNDADTQNEDVGESLSRAPVRVDGDSHPASAPSLSPVKASLNADLTRLPVVPDENSRLMVELVAKKHYQRVSSYQEDHTSTSSSQSCSPVNQCSVEDSLKNRLSSKSDVDDPWPTSQSKDYNFGDKTALKPNSREVPPAPGLPRKNTSKCGTEDNDADTQNEDVGESLSRAPVRVDGDSHPASAPSLSPVKASLNADLTRLPVVPDENSRLMVELVAKMHYQRVSSYQEDHTSASSSQSCSPVNQCSVEDSLKNRLSSKSDVDDPWPTSQSKDYNFGDKTALKPNSREVPPAPRLRRKNTSKCGTEDNDVDTQNEDVGESHSRAPVRVDGDSHPASAPSLSPVKASLNADLTRLPVVPDENSRLMVELVAKKHYQRVSSYQEDHTSASSSQSCSPVNQCSVEDSLKNRLSSKSDVDDPWPTSQSKDYNFGDKTALKPNSREVPPAPRLPRKNTSKCGTEDNDVDTQNEDVGESLSRAPVRVDGDSHPASAPSLSPVKASLKAGLTRLPILPCENRRLMVELVAKQHYQRVSSYQEDHTSTSSSQSCSPVNQCSVEDSLKNRLSSKSDVDDPWPTSQSKDYNFGDKTALKPNSREVPPAPRLPRKNTSKCGTEDNDVDTQNEDVGESLSRAPVRVDGDSHPASAPSLSPVKASLKAGLTRLPILPCENRRLMVELVAKQHYQRVSSYQEDHTSTSSSQSCSPVNQCSVEDSLKNRLSSKSDVDDPWPTSQSKDYNFGDKTALKPNSREVPPAPRLPRKNTSKCGTEDNDADTKNEDVGESHSRAPVRVDGDSHPASAPSLSPVKASLKADLTRLPVVPDENSRLMVELVAKKHYQRVSSYQEDHTSTSSSQSCSPDALSLLKMEIASLVYEDLIDIEKSHCEHLKKKVKKMKKEGNALEKELAEAKEVNSQLECQNMKLERDLCLFRFAFTQEGERSLAEKFFEKNMENLQRTQEQHTKEVETKLRPEMPVRSLHMQSIVKTQLNTQNDTRWQLSREQNARELQGGILNNRLCKQMEIDMASKKVNFEVLGSQEEKQDLLHTNKMLQDEFATGTWETDTMKIPNQGKEKKGKERLEEDLESSCARLTTPVPDHDQSRTSRRDVELDVQKARNEKYCSQVKVKSELSSLKDKNEILSQQLAQVELKFSTLEIELQHTKDALREKTLVLERVQRDLSQRECQKKELEHMLQNEQSKVDKYIGNQESLKERISQLESVNMLLRQQLQDAYCNKAKEKEEVVIMILNHYQDIITKLQGESEKQGQRNKELIDECKHLRERMYQYEHQKAEREKQAASQEKLESAMASMRKQMECRIKDLEHELFMKRVHETSNLRELENYKQLYQEEVKATWSLAEQLHRANEDLEKSKLQLLLEKQQHRTYLTPLNVRSALEPPDVGNLRNTWVLHGNFTVSENLMTPTRNQRSSFDTYLTTVEKEFHKVLNREFEKAAVETAAECRRLLPLHSAGNPVRTEDLIAKATKEYVEILNKKYMI